MKPEICMNGASPNNKPLLLMDSKQASTKAVGK
ncbi:hypothetical protein DVH24_042211 [Malus domestica]|uniref:Uncharacterized protein n=1 Tax=Malus domestica TaxID=3750 RepID=A0A498IY53_MALDO|nr:hypothetical protein DVH24_042211 [Malus domestica]